MQLTYDDEVTVRFNPPYMPSTENISPEDRAMYGPPDTVAAMVVMSVPFEVMKTPNGKYSISLAAGPEFFNQFDGETGNPAGRHSVAVGLGPEDITALFPQIKYQLENRGSIRDALIAQYEAATNPEPIVRSEHMAWTFNTRKAAALATITRLATKFDDPLQDDMKAIADRASQDADTVVSNLSNERMLAELYHKSDKSKGLDHTSEFYKAIQQYSQENFERSKPQLDTILKKYTEGDEQASIVGAYHKAFEDEFYHKVSKAWQELRPSQTINPQPGDSAGPSAAPTGPVPELAPAAK